MDSVSKKEIFGTLLIVILTSILLIACTLWFRKSSHLRQTKHEMAQLESAMMQYHKIHKQWPIADSGVASFDKKVVMALAGKNSSGTIYFNFERDRIDSKTRYNNPFFMVHGKDDYTYKLVFDQDGDGKTIIPAGTPPFTGAITNNKPVSLWILPNAGLRTTNNVPKKLVSPLRHHFYHFPKHHVERFNGRVVLFNGLQIRFARFNLRIDKLG